ncbi:MAG: hypothetical protein E6J05_00590, partial [Chloroflexi bacterium]
GTLLPPTQVTLITSQLLIVVTFMYSGVLALSAAVVAGPLISSEVESGLLLSMLARPVRRSEVVIGKWLGLAVLVFVYAAGSAFLELAAVNWRLDTCRRIRSSSSFMWRPKAYPFCHLGWSFRRAYPASRAG